MRRSALFCIAVVWLACAPPASLEDTTLPVNFTLCASFDDIAVQSLSPYNVPPNAQPQTLSIARAGSEVYLATAIAWRDGVHWPEAQVFRRGDSGWNYIPSDETVHNRDGGFGLLGDLQIAGAASGIATLSWPLFVGADQGYANATVFPSDLGAPQLVTLDAGISWPRSASCNSHDCTLFGWAEMANPLAGQVPDQFQYKIRVIRRSGESTEELGQGVWATQNPGNYIGGLALATGVDDVPLAAWVERNSETDSMVVYVARYDDGRWTVFGDALSSSPTAGLASLPGLVPQSDGGIVVHWHEPFQLVASAWQAERWSSPQAFPSDTYESAGIEIGGATYVAQVSHDLDGGGLLMLRFDGQDGWTEVGERRLSDSLAAFQEPRAISIDPNSALLGWIEVRPDGGRRALTAEIRDCSLIQ